MNKTVSTVRSVGHPCSASFLFPAFVVSDMINLTPPSTAAWLVSLLLGGAGIAGKLGYLSVAAPNAFWLLATAFVLLLLSTVFKGL